MADNQLNPEQSLEPVFNLQRVYLKGASLELPLGAAGFLEQGAPDLAINVAVKSEEVAAGIFEVALRATVTSTLNGKTLSLVEVDEAGIFELVNVPAADIPELLEVAAPRILHPYLRAHIADLLVRATLPPFHLPDINWAAMRAERLAQASGSGASPVVH